MSLPLSSPCCATQKIETKKGSNEAKDDESDLVVDLDHETESVPLKFVFVVEGLHHFEGAGAVIIAHHREFVGAEPAALNHLRNI